MEFTHVRRINSLRDRRGVVLITAMWISIALAAVVLILCREMMVEAMTARQHLSQARVDAGEMGAEQFVLSVVEQEALVPGYKDQTTWSQRQIGDCYFWVVRPSLTDETVMDYGLIDEASKLDLNAATEEMLEYLPNLVNYPNFAAAMVDWRDTDEEVTVTESGYQGAESNQYQAEYGYMSKNAPFESPEELRLVYDSDGMLDTLLWGADTNHDGFLSETELANEDPSLEFATSRRGIMPFVTTWGDRATPFPMTSSTTTSTTGINTSTLGTVGAQNQAALMIDLNSTASLTTDLTTLLQQDFGTTRANAIITATRTRIAPQAPGGRGGGTTTAARPFTSVFDWAIAAQMTSDELSQVFPYVTTLPGTANTYDAAVTLAANSTSSTSTGTTTTSGTSSNYMPIARLNVNTANLAALECIPGLEETDAQAIIDYRESIAQDSTQLTNISWLIDVLDATKVVEAGPYVTGVSYVFSADIVTVSRDGRAFKRVKIVVDNSYGTPQIIYRRDLTDMGWPLDPTIRQKLRKGEELDQSTNGAANASGSTPGSRLTFGIR